MGRGDHGRHPLVKVLHDLVGWHDNDAAAIQDFSFTFPAIPEIGKGKHLTVPHTDVVRYLVAVDDLPLVETIRRNQALLALEGGAIGRFCCSCGCLTSCLLDCPGLWGQQSLWVSIS